MLLESASHCCDHAAWCHFSFVTNATILPGGQKLTVTGNEYHVCLWSQDKSYVSIRESHPFLLSNLGADKKLVDFRVFWEVPGCFVTWCWTTLK